METIIDREFGGERPLYNRHGLRLEGVTIHAGESSVKEGSDIEARHCRFEGPSNLKKNFLMEEENNYEQK